MPSAKVRSPICSCQRATGSCEVRMVERTQTAIGPRHRKISEQRLGAGIECRVAITTCLLGQGARHEALAHADRARTKMFSCVPTQADCCVEDRITLLS